MTVRHIFLFRFLFFLLQNLRENIIAVAVGVGVVVLGEGYTEEK